MDTNALGGVTRQDRTTRLKAEAEAPGQYDEVLAGTIDDVLAYINEHPDQADAVRAAEADGKGRKGIVGDPDAE